MKQERECATFKTILKEHNNNPQKEQYLSWIKALSHF